MHEHNRYLGQAEVLSQYIGGVDHAFPRPVPGHLQHGWHALSVCPADVHPGPWMVSFVWSDIARRRLPGSRQVVIGAPWLYLLRRENVPAYAVPNYRPSNHMTEQRRLDRLAELEGLPRETASVDTMKGGTVWFPVHGLRGARCAVELASEIATGEAEPATVVLTDPDHHIDAIRDAYRSAGLRVLGVGTRTRDVGATGPGQLERLLELFVSHRRVASNALCTSLLFGATAGLSVTVQGPAPVVARPSAAGAELTHLLGDDAAVADFAAAELGRDALLTQNDLRALFDWTLS